MSPPHMNFPMKKSNLDQEYLSNQIHFHVPGNNYYIHLLDIGPLAYQWKAGGVTWMG